MRRWTPGTDHAQFGNPFPRAHTLLEPIFEARRKGKTQQPSGGTYRHPPSVAFETQRRIPPVRRAVHRELIQMRVYRFENRIDSTDIRALKYATDYPTLWLSTRNTSSTMFVPVAQQDRAQDS